MANKLLPGLLASAVFAVSGSAWAETAQTTLTNVTDKVMVNQGEAYVPAEEGMVLMPGDQLMALESGSAQINFANGCVYQMNSNELYRVSGTDDVCAMPADAAVNQAAPGGPPAGGGTGSSTLSGIIAVGVGLGAAWAISDNMGDDNDDRPNISPQ